MDVLVICIHDYSYKTQFIWRILCRIHALFITSYMHSSRGVSSLPYNDSSTPQNVMTVPLCIMWWQFCSVECDDSSTPHNVMTILFSRMWCQFRSVECDESSVLFRRIRRAGFGETNHSYICKLVKSTHKSPSVQTGTLVGGGGGDSRPPSFLHGRFPNSSKFEKKS